MNGSTPGAGGPNASGAWNPTATNWSTDSAGSSATQVWTQGSTVVFSAGTDVTGISTVTMATSATQTAAGVTINSGEVLLAGSSSILSIPSGSVLVKQGAELAFPLVSFVAPASGVKAFLDGGTLSNQNTGNGGSFWVSTSPITLTQNGGTVDVPNTLAAGLASIYRGTISLSAGATTATLTKTGLGEFRNEGPNTANNAFTKLVVNGGTYRIGAGVTGSVETGFGAVPANPTPDAITVNGGMIGDSLGIVTNVNRGMTVGANGGGFNMGSSPMTWQGSLNGSGMLNVSGGQVLLMMGDTSNFTGGLSGVGMNLQLTTNLTVGALTGTGTVTLKGVNLTAGSGGASSTYAGAIAGFNGGGTFIKTGAGSLTLTGSNSYVASTFAAGTLVSDAAGIGINAINLDGGVTLKSNTGLTMSNTLTVMSGGAQLDGTTGGVTIQGTGNTTINGNLTVAAGTVTFNRNGGNVSISNGVGVTVKTGATANFNGTTSILFDGSNSADLTVNGTAGFAGDRTFGNLSGNGTINASAHAITINQSNNTTFSGTLNSSGSAITKNLSGSLTVNHVVANSLTVNGGTLAIAPTIVGGTSVGVKGDDANVSILNSLSVAPGATLDIGNHSIIVPYATGGTSPAAGIRASIAAAYDADNGGTWDLPGITSSAAAADSNFMTAVAYAEASDLAIDQGGTFAGQTISDEAVVVKYTYYGDANMDGVVTTDDYFAFVAGFNGQGSGWAYGDFNYDGAVDTSDLFIFTAVFNSNTENNPLSDLILNDGSLSASQKAALLSSVPEPASVGMLAIGAAAMGVRRRRKE